jgi:tRNA pseudouridine38-40 synthase
MRNIKLVLEYDGTNYFGWQKQNNAITIQGTLEKALESLVGENISVIGCSRTDSKVHAKGYVCNFNTSSSIPGEKFREALNNKLPEDIVVLSSKEVPKDFHARYHSKGKMYCYNILNTPVRSALDRNYVYHYKGELDIALIKEGSKYFIGKHDFAAFRNLGSSVQTSVRTIYSIEIEELYNQIKIYISADGFLYNMARIIVGTLLEVGCKKIEPCYIKEIIDSKDRSRAGRSVPPQGLTLVEVYYNNIVKNINNN